MSLQIEAQKFTTTALERPTIEARVLELLRIEIIDLEDYCDSCIPDNYPRFQVSRSNKQIGTISTWGNKYCTRMGKSLAGYPSLYQAATCWTNPVRLKLLEDSVESVLTYEQSLMPDYF